MQLPFLHIGVSSRNLGLGEDMDNLFSKIPEKFDEEIFEGLLSKENVRIERILSKGHTSPESKTSGLDWYDQDEHEWVVVLKGSGKLLFEGGKEKHLKEGDFLYIPPHVKHKVIWTDPEEVTIWLAVFFS